MDMVVVSRTRSAVPMSLHGMSGVVNHIMNDIYVPSSAGN